VRLAKSWRPDVIFCGSGLTAPAGLAAARICGARLVVYAHGLDLIISNTLYRRLFLPTIRAADRVIVNSRYTAGLAAKIGVENDKIRVINPGVTLVKPDYEQGIAFRQKYDLGNSPLLLSVGRLTPRKGLAEFLRESMPNILRDIPDFKLVIVGGEPTKALHGGSSLAAINAAANLIAPGAVRLLGSVDDNDLAGAYNASSGFVFPVLDLAGDVEGFGMAALEAAAYGVPSVAFANGGVVDAICNEQSGYLITPGDYDAFTEATTKILNEDTEKLVAGARAHATRLAWPLFGQALRSSVDELL